MYLEQNNWELVSSGIYRLNFVNPKIKKQRGVFLDQYITVNKPLLQIGIKADVPDYYNLGGYAIQYIPNQIANPYIRSNDEQNRNGSEYARRFIRINCMNLVTFPDLKVDYRLNIKIPYWITEAGIELWKYIGSNNILPEYLQRETSNTLYANFTVPQELTDAINSLDNKLNILQTTTAVNQTTTQSDISSINDAIKNMNNDSSIGTGGTILPGIP